jgi:hypothetical protein
MDNFFLKTKKEDLFHLRKGKDGREKWLSKYGEKPAQQQRTGTNTYGVMERFLYFLTHEISVHGAFVSFFTSLIFREMDVYKYYTGESKLDLGSAHGTRITLPSRRLMHVRSKFEIGSLGKSPQSRRGQNVSICFSVGVQYISKCLFGKSKANQ